MLNNKIFFTLSFPERCISFARIILFFSDRGSCSPPSPPAPYTDVYSSRKRIAAKHRNKSLRSSLVITRHFWLRANYLNDEIDSDIRNDVAMCGTQDTQDTDLLPFFEKRESLTHDLSLTEKTIVAHQILRLWLFRFTLTITEQQTR